MIRNNSKLTVKDALSRFVTQEIKSIVENSNTEGGVNEVELPKNTDYGTVVSFDNGLFVHSIQLDSGQVIDVTDLRSLKRGYEVGTRVFIGYENDGSPYIINGTTQIYNLLDIKNDDGSLGKMETYVANDYVVSCSYGLFIGDRINLQAIDVALGDTNGTDNQGLIIIDRLTSKINALIDEINALKQYVNTHVHTSGSVGATTSVPGFPNPTPFTGNFTKFNSTDYENPYIKHYTKK